MHGIGGPTGAANLAPLRSRHLVFFCEAVAAQQLVRQHVEYRTRRLPCTCACAPQADVDLPALALKYELSGGYIRNAVQVRYDRGSNTAWSRKGIQGGRG